MKKMINIYKKNNKINNKKYKISIVIPCRNEEKYIAKCLDSIIAQNYPIENIEILVVDGMSEDKTTQILEEYSKQSLAINILKNPKKITPCAFNLGIKYSKANIIMIMNAHSTYEKDYISKCVKYLDKYNADNVGGILITKPGAATIMGKAIALVLSHPFGVGNALFRIGVKKPQYVDTVPLGAYKREVFDKIGLFDEDLVRNQDDEFNLRLIKNGGKILLVPDIFSYRYTRESLAKLWKMYFQYGYFKPLVAKKVGGILTWRQTVPALFIGFLILALLSSFFSKFFLWSFIFMLGFYIIVNFSFSLIISIEKKNPKLLPSLIASFITLHFSYGLGYLKGIWDFIVFKKHLKKKIKDMPLTR